MTASVRLLIGSYTERLPHVAGRGRGILFADVGPTGQVSSSGMLVTARNPAYLAVDEQVGIVYAVNETNEFDGMVGGGVSAYRWRAEATGLELINSRPTGGREPVHLTLSPDRAFLLVANYSGASVSVFPVRPDGGLAEMSAQALFFGASSVVPERQGQPHPHMVSFDPIRQDLLVPDLGADRVYTHRLTRDGELLRRDAGTIRLGPGSGPRHLAFDPTGRAMFVVNELDSSVACLVRDDERFEMASMASTLPTGYRGPNQAGGIRVSSSGDRVLVTNRGHDSIAVFSANSKEGQLELLSVSPSGGRFPRDLALSPREDLLFVGNQKSDCVSVFDVSRDVASPSPAFQLTVGSPACLWVLDEDKPGGRDRAGAVALFGRA